MRKTIIISPELSKEYKDYLLQETDITFGTQIMNFDAYFFPSSINSDYELYENYHRLQQKNFEKLGDLFSFPLSIKSLVAFNKELQCYGISYDDLPVETPYDLEIKKALELLHQDIKLPDEETYFIAQGLSHPQITFLKRHNVKEIHDEAWINHDPIFSFKSGLNARLEIEGLVQHILRENIDNPLVLVPNVQESIPYFKSVFSRHNIPYTSEHKTLKEKVHQFISLLEYYQDPSIDTITKVIESQVYILDHPQQLLQYMNFYRVNKQQFFETFEFASDDYLVSAFYQVQLLIKKDHTIIKKSLTKLHNLSLQDALTTILSIIKARNPKDAMPIQNYLQNTLPAIDTETIPILKQALFGLIKDSFSTPLLTLGSYNELPLYPVNQLFILGLSAKNYPGISAPTGILDVSYRKRVRNYPSQDIQNEYQLNYKEMFFKKAKNTVLSVHELSFEGKSLDLANRILDEVEARNTMFKDWTISELNPYYAVQKKLSPHIAKELYLDDNNLLRGSVSSFELYVKEPYTYFLERGLNIKRPLDYNLFPRLRGSINHEVLETGVMDMKESLLPKNDTYVPHFIKINQYELEKHLEHLASIDNSGLLKPHTRELKVKSDNLFEGISFTGYIDRIDQMQDGSYLIIDYKSSSHTLSKTALEKGEQLQLLTYVIAFKHSLEEEASILGSYYYIFDKKKADTPKAYTYTFTKTKGLTPVVPLTEESLQKHYSIKGWTYKEISPTLVPDNLFAGRTLSTVYDLDNIEAFVAKMYQHIKDKILDGVLETDDLELPFGSVNLKGDKK